MERVAVLALALALTPGCTDRAAIGQFGPEPEDTSTSGGAAPGTGDPPWPVTDGGAPPMPPPREDTSTSEGGGVTFIDTPDGGGLDLECDLFEQDCPPGEKCMPYSNDGGAAWNATACFPIARDPVGYGETCEVVGNGVSGMDDCDAGMICWSVDREGIGHCVQMCTGSADNPTCPRPDDWCAVSGNGDIALCIEGCDPLAQDCMLEGEVCYPFNDTWGCAADASGDAGVFGDPCEFINACDLFHVCVGEAAVGLCPGALGCCTQVCDVFDGAADAECAALAPGFACEGWWREGQAPPAYEHVGVCVLPL